jgi:hypothetical protein
VGTDLTGVHILFASITPLNSAGDNEIDASFTLSEGAVSTWSDYSTSVRFNNHHDEFIDVRDNGSFNVDTQIVLIFDQMYYVWMEIDVPNKKYSVHVDTSKGLSKPVKIASDYAFRKTDIEKLAVWSVLIQKNNHIDLSRLELVDAVGDIPGQPTNLSRIKPISELTVYPNPFTDQTEIEIDGHFQYFVYDFRGALIKEGKSFGNCKLGKDLNRGLYLLKIVNNSVSGSKILMKY